MPLIQDRLFQTFVYYWKIQPWRQDVSKSFDFPFLTFSFATYIPSMLYMSIRLPFWLASNLNYTLWRAQTWHTRDVSLWTTLNLNRNLWPAQTSYTQDVNLWITSNLNHNLWPAQTWYTHDVKLWMTFNLSHNLWSAQTHNRQDVLEWPSTSQGEVNVSVHTTKSAGSLSEYDC